MKIKDRFTTLPPDLDIRITSDTHFWHGNIIRYSNRWPFIPEEQREQFRATRQADPPFTITTEIVEAMNAELLRQINQDITPRTRIYHLGDFSYGRQGSTLAAWKAIRDQIQCDDVHLVLGNHDQDEPEFRSLFQSVSERLFLKINGKKYVFDHYSGYVWHKSHSKGTQLYGHSHGEIEQTLNRLNPYRRSLDVGVDNAFQMFGQYRPFRLTEIESHFARCEALDGSLLAIEQPLEPWVRTEN